MQIADALIVFFKLCVGISTGCVLVLILLVILWAMMWIINKARRHFYRRW